MSARDTRALADIEHRLCASDPPLARLFGEFAELTGGAPLPPRGWRSRRLALAWRNRRPARGWQLAALLLALIIASALVTAICSGMAHAACLLTPEAGHGPAHARPVRASSASCRPQQHQLHPKFR